MKEPGRRSACGGQEASLEPDAHPEPAALTPGSRPDDGRPFGERRTLHRRPATPPAAGPCRPHAHLHQRTAPMRLALYLNDALRNPAVHENRRYERPDGAGRRAFASRKPGLSGRGRERPFMPR